MIKYKPSLIILILYSFFKINFFIKTKFWLKIRFGSGYYPYLDSIRRIRIRILSFKIYHIRIRIWISIFIFGSGYDYTYMGLTTTLPEVNMFNLKCNNKLLISSRRALPMITVVRRLYERIFCASIKTN